MIQHCTAYRDGQSVDGNVALSDALEAGREERSFVWVDLTSPDAEELAAVQQEFGLHPLAIEDALMSHQRPKFELYGNIAFIVVFDASYHEPDQVLLDEIHLFAGEQFVITIRHPSGKDQRTPVTEMVKSQLEQAPTHLARGAGAVIHAVLDAVVDRYAPVLDALENDIDELEADVFSAGRSNAAERIYRLKRQVVNFRRALDPLIDALGELQRGYVPLTFHHPDLNEYYRDVSDHLFRIIARLDAASDGLSDALDANNVRLGRGHCGPNTVGRHLGNELPRDAGVALASRLRGCPGDHLRLGASCLATDETPQLVVARLARSHRVGGCGLTSALRPQRAVREAATRPSATHRTQRRRNDPLRWPTR
jgi:magnesium transporter